MQLSPVQSSAPHSHLRIARDIPEQYWECPYHPQHCGASSTALHGATKLRITDLIHLGCWNMAWEVLKQEIEP